MRELTEQQVCRRKPLLVNLSFLPVNEQTGFLKFEKRTFLCQILAHQVLILLLKYLEIIYDPEIENMILF